MNSKDRVKNAIGHIKPDRTPLDGWFTNAAMDKLKSRFGIDKIYRFDLGENVDGFSPNIHNLYNNQFRDQNLFDKLNEYPNITHRQLRQKIAQLYKERSKYRQ